jgi:hypothetical protein
VDLRSVTAIAPEEGSAWTGTWTGTHETPNAACAFMASKQASLLVKLVL